MIFIRRKYEYSSGVVDYHNAPSLNYLTPLKKNISFFYSVVLN